MSAASTEADLTRLADAGGTGTIWTLEGSVDLNANLVRFEAGKAEVVDEHVNEEVDVLFVGLCGAGAVRVNGHSHQLEVGRVVLAPKGSPHSVASETESLAYLTVHRGRGPAAIGDKPGGYSASRGRR